MCRGTNGAHRHVLPGVTYCEAGRRLHVSTPVFAQHCLGSSKSKEDMAATAVLMAIGALGKLFPKLDFDSVSLSGFDEEIYNVNECA